MKSNTKVGQEINNELQLAKDALEQYPTGITIFGSARISPENPFYSATVSLARRIAEAGLPVLSGGGPGIMQAANQGAQMGNGLSVGLNIILPFEQKPNPFQHVSITFDHFASRKVSFSKFSRGFVVMPGGMGTLDELTEVLTLMQCGKMPKAPLVLYGKSFWAGLMEWMDVQLIANGLVKACDMQLLRVVDSVDEVMDALASLLPESHTATTATAA